jgi:hypothetical protein
MSDLCHAQHVASPMVQVSNFTPLFNQKKRKTGEGDASLCTVGSDLVSRIQPSFRIGAVQCSSWTAARM